MAEFAIVPLSGRGHVTIDTDNIFDQEDLDFELDRKIKGRFEEYEVQLVDGDEVEVDVWEVLHNSDYSALRDFIMLQEYFDSNEMPGIYLMILNTAPVDSAIREGDDAFVREGDLESLAHEFVEEGIIDGSKYVDIDAIARDMEINGELPEEAYDEDGNLEWNDREIKDWVEELVDEVGVPDNAHYYIDYDAIARDLGYDYTEFDFGGTSYVGRTD